MVVLKNARAETPQPKNAAHPASPVWMVHSKRVQHEATLPEQQTAQQSSIRTLLKADHIGVTVVQQEGRHIEVARQNARHPRSIQGADSARQCLQQYKRAEVCTHCILNT